LRALLEGGLNNAAWAIVLALLTAAGARVWRGRPALGHTLWLLVLLKLITPSLVVFSLAPAVQRVRDERPHGVHSQSPAAALDGASSHETQNAAATANPSIRRQPAPARQLPPQFLPPAELPRADAQPQVAPGSNHWTIAIAAAANTTAAVWLGGVIAWWSLSALRVVHFRRLIRAGSPAPPELCERIERMAKRLGLSQSPLALILPARVPPMVWVPLAGRPHLALPEELWNSLELAQQEAVLAHELAHLRRRDHWVRRLEALVCGLYWWYPVAWWARREIERAEEECCDHWVLWALPAAAAAYAETLVATAAFLSVERRTLPLGVSGVGRLRPLKWRLEMILSEPATIRLQRYTMPAIWILGALALLILPGMEWQGAPVSVAAAAPPPVMVQRSARDQLPAKAQQPETKEAPKVTAPPSEKNEGAVPLGASDPASAQPALMASYGSVKVRVQHPVVRDVIDSAVYAGHIVAARDATIRSRVSGAIIQVDTKPGQVVSRDDVLFKIDPRWYKAELDKANAELDAAVERCTRSRQEFEWTKKLADDNQVVSKNELDRYAIALREAEAARRGLEAARDVAKLNLEATEVRAPFAGTVSGPILGVGNVVVADNTPLARIASTDTVSVAFNVSQQIVVRLNRLTLKNKGKGPAWLGYPVGVGIAGEDGYPRQAKISAVDLQLDPATGNARCEAELANPDGLFLPGMGVNVRLQLGAPHRETLVPGYTVHPWGDQESVFVLTDKNTLKHHPIVGYGYYDNMRAVQGLNTDEWVVLFGTQYPPPGVSGPTTNAQLTEGMKVIPEKIPAPADPRAGTEGPG
jgi:RND family efflux transporter MFP subunit